MFYKLCIIRLQTESLCLVFLKIFERILFIWAIRHPASGYVQGINDLVTPFFVVYVFEYIGKLLPLLFVCDTLPMWQFSFFFIARLASNRAILHLARLQGGGFMTTSFREWTPGPLEIVFSFVSNRFALLFPLLFLLSVHPHFSQIWIFQTRSVFNCALEHYLSKPD